MSIGILACLELHIHIHIYTYIYTDTYFYLHVQSCTYTSTCSCFMHTCGKIGWTAAQSNAVPKPVEELQLDVLPEMPLAPPESDNGSDERDTLVSFSSSGSCQAQLDVIDSGVCNFLGTGYAGATSSCVSDWAERSQSLNPVLFVEAIYKIQTKYTLFALLLVRFAASQGDIQSNENKPFEAGVAANLPRVNRVPPAAIFS